jgi:hypothetical protein
MKTQKKKKKKKKKPVPVILWFAATTSQTEKIIFKNRIKVLVICGSDKE